MIDALSQEIRRQLVDDIVKEGTGCSRSTAYRRVYKILNRTVDDVWGLKLRDVAEDESWQPVEPSRFTLTQRVKTSQGKRVNIDDTLADANRRLADAVSFL
jgi:hypothetical protein